MPAPFCAQRGSAAAGYARLTRARATGGSAQPNPSDGTTRLGNRNFAFPGGHRVQSAAQDGGRDFPLGQANVLRVEGLGGVP